MAARRGDGRARKRSSNPCCCRRDLFSALHLYANGERLVCAAQLQTDADGVATYTTIYNSVSLYVDIFSQIDNYKLWSVAFVTAFVYNICA